MKLYSKIIFFAFILLSCANSNQRPKEEYQQPTNYTYNVVNSYPHITTSFTQGLQYDKGVLWEGTGEYGKSLLQSIDLQSGKADVKVTLPNSEFGEGITLLDNKIYQLTYKSGKMFVYDSLTFKKLDTYRYKGEGWGLTTDGALLYMSDGTSIIRKIDPKLLKQIGTISVTCRGESLTLLNELEWIDGKIWANVFMYDIIVIINPENGIVEGIIHLDNILPDSERTAQTDVLNGIAYDKDKNRIFVTGKNWSRIFEISLIEQ